MGQLTAWNRVCTKSATYLLTCLLLASARVDDLGAQTPMGGKRSAGRVLFYSASVGTNGLACIHCHADFDEDRQGDGIIRPAHSLYNGSRRETWWGKDPEAEDRYPDIASAAVYCVEHYMRNPQKLTAQQLLDLQRYLEFITKRPVRSPQFIAPAADKTGEYVGFENGNKFSGRPLFYAACHTCHPNGNKGIAPSIPRNREPSFYAQKIREGDGMGAVLSGVNPIAYEYASGKFMPFFGADRLNNEQIADIIAFVRTLP